MNSMRQLIRSISSTSMMAKRRDGHSGLTIQRRWNPKNKKSTRKHKYDLKNHVAGSSQVQLSKRKQREQQDLQEEKQWKKLEDNTELQHEYQQVFEELLDCPTQPYLYAPEEKLQDQDGDSMKQSLEAGELERTPENFHHLIQIFAAQKRPDAAESVVELMQQDGLVDEEAYIHLISSYANAKDPTKAIQVLGRMKKDDIAPSAATYTTVMNACVVADRIEWAFTLFDKMNAQRIEPDCGAFTVLISASIRQNNFDGAFDLFHMMRKHGIQLDAVAFTSLIHGYAKRGMVERAVGLFNDMRNSGQHPTHITYNVMIHACAQSTYYAAKAQDYFHWMKADGYYPDEVTYNSLLHACSRNGDVQACLTVLEDMAEHQVPWTERTYSSLINTYARAQIKRIYDQAPTRVEIRKEIEELNLQKRNLSQPIDREELPYDDDGNLTDQHSLEKTSAMFDSLSEENDVQYLIEQEAMEEEISEVDNELETFKHEVAHVDSLPFVHAQSKHIEEAKKLLQQMRENDMEPSIVTLNSMLCVYANALRLRSAEQFLEVEFESKGITPTIHTYRAMIRMYVRAKRFPQAIRVLTDMRSIDVSPDAYIYGVLVEGYARQGQLTEALHLLLEAHKNDITIEERFMRRVRRLADHNNILTPLIPEDPDAHMFMSWSKLKERKERRAKAPLDLIGDNATQKLA